MTRCVLSPRALTDIDEIWDYTAARWGPDQADSYVRDIHDAIGRIADDPRLSRGSDHVRRGYRQYRSGSHMIFFRRVTGDIEVVRILHQSMDFPRHF